MSQGGPGIVVNMERIEEEHEVFTGSAAIAATIAPGKPFQLIGLELHLNSAPAASENLTVTKDAGAGAVYDTKLYSIDLSSGSVADLVKYFDVPIKCYHKDDEIDIAWVNTNTKTYGLTVYWRALKG